MEAKKQKQEINAYGRVTPVTRLRRRSDLTRRCSEAPIGANFRTPDMAHGVYCAFCAKSLACSAQTRPLGRSLGSRLGVVRLANRGGSATLGGVGNITSNSGTINCDGGGIRTPPLGTDCREKSLAEQMFSGLDSKADLRSVYECRPSKLPDLLAGFPWQ
jgi:hypothetical protein